MSESRTTASVGTQNRERGTVTRILSEAATPDDQLINEVIPLVYDELSVLARHYLRREREDHTLDTRALVHEAYFRLMGQRVDTWQSRRHFFGVAARHMRRILCDYARHRKAEKRGGRQQPVRLQMLDDLIASKTAGVRLEEVMTFEHVLQKLERRDPDALEIVHLRCILGFKMTEISQEMGIPMRTLSRKWRWIRAWLVSELRVQESQPLL